MLESPFIGARATAENSTLFSLVSLAPCFEIGHRQSLGCISQYPIVATPVVTHQNTHSQKHRETMDHAQSQPGKAEIKFFRQFRSVYSSVAAEVAQASEDNRSEGLPARSTSASLM